MDKETIVKLLGRPLTSYEDSNFTQIVEHTISTLSNTLCWQLKDGQSDKTYYARANYRTLWISLYTLVDEVKVDGRVVADTDYKLALNADVNSSIFNSVIFKYPLGDSMVEIKGSFDISKITTDVADLGSLVADLFKFYARNMSSEASANIKSKHVEDFTITFSDDSELQALFNNNYATIKRYSACEGNVVQSGSYGKGMYGYF